MPATIKKNVLLAPRTTLSVGGEAEYFAQVTTVEELREVLVWAKREKFPWRVLAGGTNVLIPDVGLPGLTVCPSFLGASYEGNEETLVTVGAGVILDTLVSELVEKKIWGLENLSSIPGTVGAVPIQNVGAYGVEAKDIVHSVTVFNIETDTIEELSNDACVFGYRDSIFKHEGGKHYIITAVTFRVSSQPRPQISYRDLATFFKTNSSPSIAEIRDAVIQIRGKKFPDWNVVGTAGSFFKNPIIARDLFEGLRMKYPELPGYEVGGEEVKVSLGWVLDKICGLKGYEEHGIGLYREQALVLVCKKGSRAVDIVAFSQRIIDMVFSATGIVVEREVTILT